MEHNQNNQMQNNVKNIYPQLPSTDETADEGHNFRLNDIQKNKKYLEEEIVKRESLVKISQRNKIFKCHRCRIHHDHYGT